MVGNPLHVLRGMALALCLLPALARAQTAAPPDGLRAEVERAQAAAPSGLPGSVWTSIAYQLDVADRIQKDYATQATAWRARARNWLTQATRGQDPLQAARGQIVMRGYDSQISKTRQGYAIYLPKNYDPARSYPLMIALHGGSANGNLFLGVVLGNNMNWKEYDKHLWDEFTPKWTPDWIVVAPDGFGQVMWRFMGEQDVLDVIADVQTHYKVDADRVVLCGLSNGGVGAYSLGTRYAWRFSAVLAIAGAPSWLQYANAAGDPLQAEALHPISGMSLAENVINTDFRYYHGNVDPGPMRPAYVQEFSKRIATLGVPYREKWFEAGHDLLYLVHRHGLIFGELEGVKRNPHPKEVRVVTGDYRANRQHWLSVTRLTRMPELARVRAVAEGDAITLETKNADAVALEVADVPLAAGDGLRVIVDGQAAYTGSRGKRLELYREGGKWKQGPPPSAAGPSKRPGVSGPITDAYFGAIAHVYGTGDAELAPKLKRSAERGAKGWPLWLWRVDQAVVADSEVTPELMRTHHLVLYGTPGTNSVLSQIQDRLPIRVDTEGVRVGDRLFSGEGVGVKFVYPNPLASERYVIVQAGPTVDGVNGGHNLPDFLPDYVVYDAKTTRSRPRLLFGGAQRPLALGYFDSRWQIDPSHGRSVTAATPKGATAKLGRVNEGNGPESAENDVPRSKLPVPSCPPAPPAPTKFCAAEDTQAGKIAREIAARVQTFQNFRGKIPGATWTVDDASVWSIRDEATCLETLPGLGVNVSAWTGKLPTPVAVPVKLTHAAVGGVEFRFMHAGAGVVVSCELAARLADVASIVKRHGVHTVYVLSAYRDHPYTSFHTLGLALDISRFDTADGPLTVKTDFTIDRNRETCDKQSGPALGKKAQKLLDIACDLATSHRFSSVLTPNYNAGHRDHFHVDIRPDDPRLFLR
ncbi:MAG TPA: extensin family protein [Polyangiales bacterium]|nr:extensin family protein [Polyangiales bacterium]